MSSSGGSAERTLRLILKLAQLLASLYLIIAMYNIGPHWILLVASLAVPLYGLFLLFRSPERTFRNHPLPYVRYKALARARSWLRVDLAICGTMAIVCLAFALVLLIAYFEDRHFTQSFLLQGAIAALLLFFLYSLNALLSVRQLQMGRVDFLAEKKNASISTTRASTQSPLGDLERRPPSPQQNGHFPPYRAFEEGWRSNGKPVSIPSSSEGPSLLEQLQSEIPYEHPSNGNGRWRQIPIEHRHQDRPMWTGKGGKRVEEQIRVEQRRTTPHGMDLGTFGTRDEKWLPASTTTSTEDEEGEGQSQSGEGKSRNGAPAQSFQYGERMLPRLAVQKDGDGWIRGEWRNNLSTTSPQYHQVSGYPQPAKVERDVEVSRTTERKRLRYETVASKSLVDVDRVAQNGGNKNGRLRWKEPNGRKDFDVSIRSRSTPQRHSAELRLKDDGRVLRMPHQVTEL